MSGLLALGECMIELVAGEAGTFRRGVGGDTLNTLAMAARLGTQAAYATRFGRDLFEPYLTETLAAFAVSDELVRRVDGFNAVYFIEVDAAGERRFHYLRGGSAASGIEAADLPGERVAAFDGVFASGITQALAPAAERAVVSALAAAKEAGKLTAYDINWRPKLTDAGAARRRLAAILPLIDVLFLSGDDREVVEGLSLAGPRLVATRAGADPVRVEDRRAGVVYAATPPRVEVVDTSGAGDIFNGAFLSALLAGEPVGACTQLATAAASLQVTRRGTLAALPAAAEVRALAALTSYTSCRRPGD